VRFVATSSFATGLSSRVGYNTSFHMALDKFFMESSKFKELVDVCHQKWYPVILDLMNHAFDRNPMVRMWMRAVLTVRGSYTSAESPYFNTVDKAQFIMWGGGYNHQYQGHKTVKRVLAMDRRHKN
jgi:hypothetical protein